MMVIGSAQLALEFLTKHCANTIDRPRNIGIVLSGHGWNFSFMPYNQFWRRQRREFRQFFQQSVVLKFKKVQQEETYRFLARLVQSPTNLRRHVKTLYSAIMLKIIYGIDVAGDRDEYIRLADLAIEALAVANPGRFAVEIFPFLRYVPAWMPGAGFQELFASCNAAGTHLKHAPFDEARIALESGKPRDCVVAGMLARASATTGCLSEEDEDLLKSVCGTAFDAGSDTTHSALTGVFVAFALHPDVQKKAQAELDAVVGPVRLPDHSDVDKLVYVQAIVKETLRWHSLIPMGLPHRLLEDDEFLGYFLPAGTVVMANVWEMMHDPDVWDQPDEFRPERFIKDGQLDPTDLDPISIVFGFGRRNCPGRLFALDALSITIASVLQTLDVSLPVDESGHPIQIEYALKDGFLSYPEDCRCTIRPRSAKAEALIFAAQREPSATGEDQ
ncbi:CyP450 monooxygenase [Trametes elegans]|nr:CyP450 monooxygenase [Trametes elegans]